MEIEVFLIVLFSGFLHAIWNSMASKYEDKNVSIGAIVYGHVPLCIVAIIYFPAPSIESFPYIFLSALIHQGYQNFLLTALPRSSWIWTISCHSNFNYFFRCLSKDIYHLFYSVDFNRSYINWSF